MRFAPSTVRPALTKLSLFACAACLPLSGCKKQISDADLTTTVQAALSTDAAIKQQPVQVAVNAGVVTLSGNVSDDTASSVAAEDAARVTGVKEVVNSLSVAGVTPTPTVVTSDQPKVVRTATVAERRAIAARQPLPPPSYGPGYGSSYGSPSGQPSGGPPPPSQPVVRDVTVPAGTTLPIRITQTLDSETAQVGQPFSGVVVHEIAAAGMDAIPAGSGVTGRVIGAKDAGHFKGSSEISIELTSVSRHGQRLAIATAPYSVEGKGRGANSAEKIGGGAAVGAVLGGIFGGGRGAAIGAAAGGGGGAAYQGFTRGQQVTIPSESVIHFQLTAPVTVRTAETAADGEGYPGLLPR